MPIFEVTRYWHTNETIEVEAATEEEALEKSRYINYDPDQIFDGLIEDGSPDVVKIED